VSAHGDVAILEVAGWPDRWQWYAIASRRSLGQPGDSGTMLYDSSGRAACLVSWGYDELVRCIPVGTWRRIIPVIAPRVSLGVWP
jgi:hypothetical protein